MAVGVLGGVLAWLLRGLIAFFHDLAFLGRLSFVYDANQHTPLGPLGPGVALVPALGALAVVFLIRRFAPEARGHGVPEVMDAIHYQKGVIRPVVALIKALASAITIGTGGSVGREGPIIQIGAAAASACGQVLGVSRWQLATLVGAGGGAGIAATFNTPIGGILFAVEVLLPEVSARTLVPVALATATATAVGRALFGDTPAFHVPPLELAERFSLLPVYLGLGALSALAAVAFIRAVYGAEDLCERWVPNPYLRHVLGMLAVGGLFTTLAYAVGHYHVAGIGYATVVEVITGKVTGVGLLLLLFALKMLATSLTLGSGGSGGIFSPCLFLGATLGAAYGLALDALLPGHGIQPAVLALAGMAGVLSGATGATLTAVVMVFEMTRDYAVILPMALSAAVGRGLARALLADTIYSLKLSRRGHALPEALHANAHLVHHVADLSLSPVHVHGATPEGPPPEAHLVVLDGAEVVGVAPPERASVVARATELASADFVVVTPDRTLFQLLADLQAAKASTAVVVAPGEPGRVLGVITKAHLAEALAEGLEMFEG
ncbi:MAG: chloride channel protein [Planctomycetota bacterium]